MKQVIFVNPDYYTQAEEYDAHLRGASPFSFPPIQSGFGQVVEEKGGIVTKVKTTQQGPDGKYYERIIDVTKFIIVFVDLLNQLIPSVKILLSSIFGNKQTKANIKEIKKIRRELKNYNK